MYDITDALLAVAKDSDAGLSTRASAAKDAVSDKGSEAKDSVCYLRHS